MKHLCFVLFLFSFSFFAFFSSGTMDSQDGFQYLAVARNMYYLHRPIAPPPEYPQKNVFMNVNKAKDGSYYSPTGAGYSIAMIPSVVLSDFLHRIYHVSPPEHFPLETDWAVLLFASFTNAFFAALLVVLIFSYLRFFKISTHTALACSFLTILATNLFPLAKESFAHMMYITFLVSSFYFVKKYSLSCKLQDIVMAAISFGITVNTYNPIFILSVLPIVIYFIFLQKPLFRLYWVKRQITPIVTGILSFLPFGLFYLLYNSMRTGAAINSGYGLPTVSNFIANAHILFEGLYGLLFSPGRGLFLYSPILVVLILFWHKLPLRKMKEEFLSFGLLSVIHVYFYAVQNGGPDWYQWNGESSWGPRYLGLLIPFLMIFVAAIITRLTRLEKRVVLYPLILISFFVQMMGVLLPYQIKFHDLEPELRLNGTRITTADYANFLPRYSPLINMPRELIKRFVEFPQTISHGKYDARFIDGVDYPFKLGNNEQWRGLQPTAYISVNVPTKQPLSIMKLGFSNTRLSPISSHSAEIKVLLNGKEIGKTQILPDKWGELTVRTEPVTGKNEIILQTTFVATTSAQQVLFLRSLDINDTPVSLKTLDLPYVQPLAQRMTNATYRYFGVIQKEPWFFWSMHSQVYEGTLDLWWVKALYYRDLPRSLFTGMFLLFLALLVTSSIALYVYIYKKRKDRRVI